MENFGTVTVFSRNRVTLPKAVRDRLDLRPGDKIDLQESDNGGWILTPLHGRPTVKNRK